MAESVLPETDADSVRLMTIHAAKGLRFPMVVLSGMTTGARNESGVRLFWKHDGGYAVSLGKDLQSEDVKDQVPRVEQMSDYERLRPLYVAAARARDHLVGVGAPLGHPGHQRLQARGGWRGEFVRRGAAAGADSSAPQAAPVPMTPPPDLQCWFERPQRAVERSRFKPAQSASGLEGNSPRSNW